MVGKAVDVCAAAAPIALCAAYVMSLAAVSLVRRKRQQPLKLFIHPMSQPARACWSLHLAAGLPADLVELHCVALEKGEHKTPEFLAINPQGAVPALTQGAFTIGESHTIMRYLCQTTPGVADHWYPRVRRQRARALPPRSTATHISACATWHRPAPLAM